MNSPAFHPLGDPQRARFRRRAVMALVASGLAFGLAPTGAAQDPGPAYGPVAGPGEGAAEVGLVPDGLPPTLAQLADRALSDNPQVIASRAALAAAQADLEAAQWLRYPGLSAEALTALAAAAMLACLLTGTVEGLIAGAVLFQIASVVDGIDAATNLGFLAGVIVNLWLRGETGTALIGLAGLGLLALGMGLLGLHARARGEPLHFDGAKAMLGARETALKRWLRYLTMRDFYCLFLAVMIVAGLVTAALAIFTAAAAIWLLTVVGLLWRARA